MGERECAGSRRSTGCYQWSCQRLSGSSEPLPVDTLLWIHSNGHGVHALTYCLASPFAHHPVAICDCGCDCGCGNGCGGDYLGGADCGCCYSCCGSGCGSEGKGPSKCT